MLLYDIHDNRIVIHREDGAPMWTLSPVKISATEIIHDLLTHTDDSLDDYINNHDYYRKRPCSFSPTAHDISHCLVQYTPPKSNAKIHVKYDKEGITIGEPQYFGSYMVIVVRQYPGGYCYDIEQRNSFHVDVEKYAHLHQAVIIVQSVLEVFNTQHLSLRQMSEIFSRAIESFGEVSLTSIEERASLLGIIQAIPPEDWMVSNMSINTTEGNVWW